MSKTSPVNFTFLKNFYAASTVSQSCKIFLISQRLLSIRFLSNFEDHRLNKSLREIEREIVTTIVLINLFNLFSCW